MRLASPRSSGSPSGSNRRWSSMQAGLPRGRHISARRVSRTQADGFPRKSSPRMTRREFMALALGWLASAHASAHEAAHAHEPDAEEIALGSLADAELAFATTASRDGRRAAVFSHAARGAVLLDERIIGLRELANAPVESTRHQSQPAQIGVARGHDLGYASGAYRDDHAAGAPVHGVFLRLWQRQGSGPWRIVVSAGIRTPGPVDFIALGAAPRPSYAGKAD